MDGHLSLVCARVNERSALTTMGFDGLLRASRALAERDGAVRVLASTLGPGMLAGDRATCDFEVGSGATLIVASQMATPIFAGSTVANGGSASRSETSARIAAGGALYVLAEPLLLAARACHETLLELDVAGDGFALLTEIVVLGGDARLSARTSARIDGRLAVRDACDLEGDGTDRAILTAIVVTASAERRAALEAAFARVLTSETIVRAGLGATGAAIVVRARARGAWALQCLLERIACVTRAAARDARDTALV